MLVSGVINNGKFGFMICIKNIIIDYECQNKKISFFFNNCQRIHIKGIGRLYFDFMGDAWMKRYSKGCIIFSNNIKIGAVNMCSIVFACSNTSKFFCGGFPRVLNNNNPIQIFIFKKIVYFCFFNRNICPQFYPPILISDRIRLFCKVDGLFGKIDPCFSQSIRSVCCSLCKNSIQRIGQSCYRIGFPCVVNRLCCNIKTSLGFATLNPTKNNKRNECENIQSESKMSLVLFS